MNDRIHAGVSALSVSFVGAVALVRWAVTGGRPARHRGPRAPRRIEVEVPGHVLIPALAYGAVVPQSVAYCRGCRTDVPVTVHGGGTYRCDQQHLTIHATTGDHR